MARKTNTHAQSKSKSPSARERTADTIQRILAFFFTEGIYAKRVNVVGIPIHGVGGIVGFRPSTMVGFPDILAIRGPGGSVLCVEVKTGKDRLRPEQEGTHQQIRRVGGVVLVVKDFADFKRQYDELMKEK